MKHFNGYLAFDTKEEAEAYIEEETRFNPRLEHGQYSPDRYRAKKFEGEDLYGIEIETFYYEGTLNAPPEYRFML